MGENRIRSLLKSSLLGQKRSQKFLTVSRSIAITSQVFAEILGWILVALIRGTFYCLQRLARCAGAHPIYTGATATSILVAALASVVLAPDPRRDFGDFEQSLVCLAENLYHEGRGEPHVAQIAIAWVVMNRVYHDRFPETVCSVIKQGGEWPHHDCQFSWWCDGKSDAIADTASMSKVFSLAREILEGRHEDPTGGAMWYHTTNVTPDWRKEFSEGPTLGNHIFYHLR